MGIITRVKDAILSIKRNEIEELKREIEELKKECWMRTFGYDAMISELQLAMIEQVLPGNRKHLEELRDTHVGERCIIVGNGPSLKPEDLDKISDKGIFSFGVKGIYKIYDRTKWRPNFWAASDLDWLQIFHKEVLEKVQEKKLICATEYIRDGVLDRDAIYYPFIQSDRNPRSFDKDILKGVHFYGTITGKLIQIAVYMGFNEIYLIGCDMNLTQAKEGSGEGIGSPNHFEGYMSIEEENKVTKYVEDYKTAEKYVTKSFEDIKWVCDNSYNVSVYNATRGGTLEVFERKNLDELLGE